MIAINGGKNALWWIWWHTASVRHTWHPLVIA